MTKITAHKFSSPPQRSISISASSNLVKQLPLIAQTFPQIARAHPGTLNLHLQQPLLVMNPDHRTPPLDWNGNGKPEVFDLVSIELSVNGANYPAWLYVAHDSHHRKDFHSHEVITPTKAQICDGDLCVLHIPKSCQIMSYRHCPLVII